MMMMMMNNNFVNFYLYLIKDLFIKNQRIFVSLRFSYLYIYCLVEFSIFLIVFVFSVVFAY